MALVHNKSWLPAFVRYNKPTRKEPMKYFTQDALNPNERTLELIKKIAYTYRVIKMADGSTASFCLN